MEENVNKSIHRHEDASRFCNSDFSSLKKLGTIKMKKTHQITQGKQENLKRKAATSALITSNNENKEFSDDIREPLGLESLQ